MLLPSGRSPWFQFRSEPFCTVFLQEVREPLDVSREPTRQTTRPTCPLEADRQKIVATMSWLAGKPGSDGPSPPTRRPYAGGTMITMLGYERVLGSAQVLEDERLGCPVAERGRKSWHEYSHILVPLVGRAGTTVLRWRLR
jgi:hypothetical protein